MIPKIIHYCWFGRNPKSELIQKCIESWKRTMPEWEIREWNEDNVDLSRSSFAEGAYQCQKYAFVSDIVRLWVVYEYGGIYLDTDVELYSSLEEYSNYNAFMFFHNHYQINTGVGFGAIKNHPLIRKMIEPYEHMRFNIEQMNEYACPLINTASIKEMYPTFEKNGLCQIINNDIFVDYIEYYKIAQHYGSFSWINDEQKKAQKYVKKERNWKIRQLLRNPQMLAKLSKYPALNKAYTFLTFDFIDYGPVYWGHRIKNKLVRRMKK